ncbi:nuclear pore complex protein Nup153-like [Bolinopsis microptera]|uniref:nuclear pore complex protein Nup153-like n=1 Tax=Bolinopsis microptera TaxID=2820187 RepID=UPI003079FE24
MVDQPEGRPKSPGPGKVKPVTKKHSVSKPYERPSSSRGVLARVKELITPVTPGWLKDLVLRPPQTTSVTDALEQTIAEVQAADEKGPEEFKKTLKSLSIPVITEAISAPTLPFTTERIPVKPKISTPSILDVTEVNTSLNQTNLNKTNVLEETLGEIKWSSIRPAVKEKYAFSVAAFNTPSKSPNLSSISIHNKSLTRPNSSPFTNRSRVSFGGNSLQRTLLHNRTANNTSATAVKDDKKPIKVKPISRTSIRPGVTSNTAKKILEQLESLSRPLGHLPSSRPSTPSSRPCSRASTPLSLSRPSTPQHLQPYKSERTVPIRSLTSTPLEKLDKPDMNSSIISNTASVGGKIKREKTNHYSRIKEEEEEELIVPDFETVSVPKLDFKPIVIEHNTDHKPIKIVNQTHSAQKEHVSLKDAIKTTLTSNISPLSNPLIKKKSLSPDQESSSDSSFSFSAPISVTNALVSSTSLADNAEFSFGTPGSVGGVKSAAKSMSVEDILRSDRGEVKDEEKVKIATQQPPGSWSCVPCKLSNPSAMTRCSGCEAPNHSLQLPGLFTTHSPIGIKRAPITPMKPACSPKQAKLNPLTFGMNKIKEESKEEKKSSPLVKFSFAQKPGWSCDTCMVDNKEEDKNCAACQTPKPFAAPEKKPLANKLAGMDNPLLKFKKTDMWSCGSCMLSNPADLTKCQACETAKPAVVETKKPALNPLLALSQKAGWTCDTCMLQNDSSVGKCSACETPKPGADKPADKPASSTGVFQQLGKFKQSGWSCGMCMLTNTDTDLKCKACQTLKPGVKPEDIKEEVKEEKTEAAKSSFSFGMSSVAGLNDSKAGFGDIKPSSTFSFGAKGDSGDVKGGFSFGVKKIEDKPDKPAEEKPALSFGAATGSKRALETTEEVKPVEAKPAFNFGAPVKEETTKPAFGSLTSDTAPKFNFGGNKAENKTETTAAPAFNFGGTGTATTTPSKAPAFNFGGNTPTTGPTEAKPAAGFSFGGAAPSSTTPSTGLNFGGTTTNTTAAAPAFNFGGPKPATKTSSPAFNFGGTPAPKTETPSFQFGAAPAPTGENSNSRDGMDASNSSQSPKGFSFGQKPAAASNGPSFSFGANNNNQSSAGFTFGASTTTTPAPAFGSSSSTPAFGAGTTPAPSFGSTSATGFGSNSASTAAPAFNFGGQSNSTFGQSPASNTPSFNFGGPAKPASTGFSFPAPAPSQPASTGFKFGGNSTPTPAPSFNFGGGAAPAATNSKPFSFGGGGNTSTPAPAPSFGGANSPAPPSFGNTAAIPAPSFNFGAGTAAPPNAAFQFGNPQSTPTQNNNNMFNPVTSSTTGRRIKKAVRRTKR